LPSAVETAPLTVAEYASRVGRALRAVGAAVVEGEVQRPSISTRGLMYFDLSDGDARLSCKVWPQDVRRLEHRPRAGDLVRVHVDRPELFAGAGKLDLVVSRVRLAGEGELLRRREELLRRLRAEGLCDAERRKPLPPFPRAVGVVAGRGSDGLADVVRALRDRFPPVHIVTCCALVQGLSAPASIIEALARLECHPLVDVVVIARGGGSVRDLVAFDDERLCRAIFACRVPVVAAIGHTDNVPVCNHVTWSAATPSRSPDLVVPSAEELMRRIERARELLARVPAHVSGRSEATAGLRERIDVRGVLEARRAGLDERARAAALAQSGFMAERRRGLTHARAVLEGAPRRVPDARALDPLAHALAARARTFFGAREGGLAEARVRVTGTGSRLARRAREVDESDRRVRAGIRRELADHERDYGRALARHVREARSALGRSLDRRGERLGRGGGDVAERARRGLAERERALAHLVQLVEARDLRRRGWLLATDARGRPVTGVAALRPGARIQLHLRDGAARAAVEHVTRHEEAA
jgi:exodeoxyribonuclease VII large subunit